MTLSALGIFSAAGAGGVAAGSYDLLETYIVPSTQASFTFSSLGTYSADYKHLQIRAMVRGSRADLDDPLTARFNGLSSGFFSHNLRGNGSSVISEVYSGSEMRIGIVPASTSTANNYGAVVLDVLDAFSTTKNKTFRVLSGNTSPNFIGLYSGSNSTTSALTEIRLAPQVASLAAGSRFSLYGLKG